MLNTLLEQWLRELEALLHQSKTLPPTPADLEQLAANRDRLLEHLSGTKELSPSDKECILRIQEKEQQLFQTLREELEKRRHDLDHLRKLDLALKGYRSSTKGISRFIDTHS
jgi:hypothetical protein